MVKKAIALSKKFRENIQMYRKTKPASIASLCGSVLLFSAASAEARGVEWVAQVGLDFGGDEIASVIYSDGSDQTINAGGMLQFGGGILIDTMANSNIYQTQLTINWKFDSSNASNGDVSWDRYPLELMQFYNTDLLRIGGGLTYHLSPSLTTSGFASGNDLDFDNALGFVMEVDYKFSEKGFVGARLTSIEYQLSNSSETIDGSSFGITLGGYF